MAEGKHFHQLVGEVGAESRIIERFGGKLVANAGDGGAEFLFFREREFLAWFDVGEDVEEFFPGENQAGGSAGHFEFADDAEVLCEGNFGGENVGDAGREVVGFVDDEQGFGGGESGLIEEQAAIGGGENVVVIADPDVDERENRAGDFVGADSCVAAVFAEGIEFERGVGRGEKAGQAAAGPAVFEVVEKRADFAETVENGVHAMFAFVADLHERDGRLAVEHLPELGGGLDLAGGFAGEENDAGDRAGAEAVEGVFERDAGFSESGGGFEEGNFLGGEGGFDFGLDVFLSGTGRGKRQAEGECAEAVEVVAAAFDEPVDFVELAAESVVGFRIDGDGLGHPGLDFNEDEFGADRFFAVSGGERIETLVGEDLEEVGGVGGAQVVLVGGEGEIDGFDFADRGFVFAVEDLVGASLKFENPIGVRPAGGDFDFEFGGGIALGEVFAELGVPGLAELGAPETAAAAARSSGRGGAVGEFREFADRERNRFFVEGNLHESGVAGPVFNH